MARTAPIIDYTQALRVVQSVNDPIVRAKVASMLSWDGSEQRDALESLRRIANTMRPVDLSYDFKPHIIRSLLVTCGYSEKEATEKVK